MSDDIDPAFKAAWRESQGQPVDAEPRTNYIAEAITEAFGERCPDYEPGCHCCEAWKQYDALAAVSQEPAPVGYVTPDSIREVAAGNIGNHLFPKGTLRPENEIPVYAASVPPVVGEDAREALKPFSTFATEVVEQSDAGWVWKSSLFKDRICDWFGPSDFGLLTHFAALPQEPAPEPVAWRYRYNGQWYLSQSKSFASQGFNLQPLYAAPVAAPLVGEEAVERALAAWQQALIDAPDEPVDARRRRCIRAALSASSVAMPVGGQTVLPVAVELGRKAVRGSTIATETQGLIRDPLQNYVTIEDALSALAQPAQGWRDPEGWKLVPVEPNEAMLSIGVGGAHGLKRQIWKAMLAAAPAPAGGADND